MEKCLISRFDEIEARIESCIKGCLNKHLQRIEFAVGIRADPPAASTEIATQHAEPATSSSRLSSAPPPPATTTAQLATASAPGTTPIAPNLALSPGDCSTPHVFGRPSEGSPARSACIKLSPEQCRAACTRSSPSLRAAFSDCHERAASHRQRPRSSADHAESRPNWPTP